MRIKISHVSNILIVIAIILGGYAMIDVYLVKRNLPQGVCPAVNNRPLLYAAISICIVSFIISFIKDRE